MGKVKKGEACSVRGCANTAVRSLSPSLVSAAKKAGFDVEDSGRLYLCDDHYKQFKKKRSGDERLERWRYSG